MELKYLSHSSELDSSSVEGFTSKLQREARLLLGGLAEGTKEAAVDGVSSPDKWGRTALAVGLAAGLTIAMRRPGLWGNVARSAGTLGAASFAYDLTNTDRLGKIGSAMSDTWASSGNFDSNYEVIKKQLGPIGFDTLLGVGGGALGAGLAWRFHNSKLGLPPQALEPVTQTPGARVESLLAAATPEVARLEAGKVAAMAEKPLNVFSKSDEALGRSLSNFAHTPFELDGVKYASVEAFYQALKFVDPVKRAEIAPLYGSYAKSAGNKSVALQETTYMGQTIKLGSSEHHALIERAIRAKLEQNPAILQALVETQLRPVVHDTGHVSTRPRKSNFPDDVFSGMIARLRDDYASRGVTYHPNMNATLLDAIDVKGGKSPLVEISTRNTVTGADVLTPPEIPLSTVSQSLLGIKNPRLQEFHNLEGYAKAFDGFDRKVSGVLGGGSDSVVLRLQDGNVLKITTHAVEPAFGTRPFDMPIIERGSRFADGRQINYFVQPFASKPLKADLQSLYSVIRQSGYHFEEPFLNQIGRLQDKPLLLDPWAVKPLLPGN